MEANAYTTVEVDDFQSITGKGAEGIVDGKNGPYGSVSWISSISTVSDEVIEQANSFKQKEIQYACCRGWNVQRIYCGSRPNS